MGGVYHLNSRVLHPVARVSLKFIKVQTPPYATSVLVFHSFYFSHTTCFGLFIGHLQV
jgi:hypothetical protein